jgi:isopenicillin N synthase-like dioxygenase
MILYTPPRPAQHIPVVDLAAPAADAARRIHEACRDTGFFYVANHGVPAALLAAEFEWARRFFALPLEAKLALHMNNSPSFAGYEPIAGQTLDADSPPDLKESFYCAQELPDDHPYVRARLRAYGGNQWPPGLPGFRAQMLAYYAAVRALGERLMGLVALSLELPRDHFVPLYRYPAGNVRLIRYPPQPADARFNQLGAGAHTDWGGITLLAQDDIGGLEVENAAGEWIAARPIPGTFVINLGDMMKRWTNGLYHSNLHRVLNNDTAGRDRYSIAYFYSPDHYARVECLPTCQGPDNPPKFAPCTAGEHLREMFDLTYGRKAA